MKNIDVDKLKELFIEMVAHLEYTGWGDSWERECYEHLRQEIAEFCQKHGIRP